jgi:membrane associated rhomboid family serine protease
LALDYLAMDTAGFISKLRLWQPLTAIFLHGNLAHFLGNMVFLWFFGSALANAWRRREFLGYFFLCGVAASLLFFLFNVFRSGSIKGLGASGAVFGLMIAYAMVFGERTILAFFMIPMKAKHFVAICFAIEILMLFAGGRDDGVAHIAHLGGAVCGAVCLKLVWRRQAQQAGETDRRARASSRIGGLEIMDEDR